VANNTVHVTFKVNSDGTLQQVANQAQKTAKSMDKATESTIQYNRHARGVANLQQNQTKAFAATARGTSGLVAAYATLMANVFALTAAFGALQRAAALEQLEKGLIAVGNAAGQNLPYVARELQQITGNAVTLQEAMEGTALAMSAGFGINQLKDLAKVAKGASIALGRNMGDALTRLVKGTAKLEPEILDELGILVRIDKASSDYAATLGKTVTELTRFEKQQAFLNATIDQGQKKFSVVLDSIDPDPYSKLGAAFQDLVKDITTTINKGLIPLINFLSENRFAMMGGIILFASSITRMLLPALADLSAANAASAAESSRSAQRAAKVVSSQYTNAVKQVNTAFKTVPPSVKAVEEQFRAGGLTVQQYQAHLKNLMKSERLRRQRLDAGTVKNRAQKKKELADIQALIAATQQLVAAEGSRMVASEDAIFKKQSSRMSKRQSKYQNVIAKSGVVGGFKAASRGAKEHFKDLGKVTGKLNKTKAAFEATAKSASLFGSSLLKMIPWIGWIMTGVSILGSLFGDLFKKSKVAQSTDEVVDSFDSFVRIASQLNTELEKTDTLFEKGNKILAVRVGLVNQVAAGIDKVIATEEDENAKKRADALSDLIDAQEKLAQTQERFPDLSIHVTNAQNKVLKAQIAYDKELEKSNKLSAESVRRILAESAARLEATGLVEKMGKEFQALEKLRADMEGKEFIDPKVIKESLEGIEKPVKKLKASQQEAREAALKLGQAVLAQTEAAQGMFGELFQQSNSLLNALIAVEAGIEATGTTNIEPVEADQIEQVERLAKALGVVLILEYGMGKGTKGAETATVDYVATLEQVTRAITRNNKLAATFTERSRKLNSLAKEFGTITKANAEATKLQLSLRQQANQVTEAGLNAQLQNLLATEGEESKSKEVLKLKEQILNVQKELRKSAEFSEQIELANIAHQQRINNALSKQLTMREKIAKNAQSVARMELELARAQGGKKLGAKDEARLLKEAEQTNSKLRQQKLEQEKAKINLEYDLMHTQFELEKIRVARIVREENLARQQLLQAQLASGELFDHDLDDPGQKIKEALAEIERLQNPFDTQDSINALTAPITKMQALIEGAPAALNEETGATTPSTEGLRASALAQADSDSTTEGATASHNIAMAQIKAEQEALEYKKSLHSDIAAAAIQGRHDIRKAEENAKNVAADPVATEKEKYDAKMGVVIAHAANVSNITSALAESMAQLGPEGALMAAVLQATSDMTTAFTNAYVVIGDETATTVEKIQAGLAAASALISGYGAISKAASDQKIAGIDQEIAAEKKRDGKSAASQAKLSALEKKKDKEKRKAFEANKKMQMGQTIISTASGIMAVMDDVPAPFNFVLAGLIAAMGAKQLSTISSTTYQGGGSASSAGGGPSAIKMGDRKNSVDLGKGGSQGGELAYARGTSGVGGMSNFTPAFSGYKNRASGGPTGFVVGEQGPELFVPEVPGNIVASGDANNQASPTNVNFSIQAVDASGVENLLTEQRGNIIRMIREAANQQGQTFLESVSETQL